MELRRWVILVCLSQCLLATPGAAKKKLEIITESKPQECTQFVESGDTLRVHYTGALENGQVFDSSRAEGREPVSIKLGAGQVIPGWEEGLIGMCEGEVRKLIIPPHLGYGDRGVEGVIPGGATLVFSVELLDLQKPPMFNIPMNRELWIYVGGFVLVVFVGYELYRRAVQQNKDLKKQQKKPSREHPSKKSKKKK